MHTRYLALAGVFFFFFCDGVFAQFQGEIRFNVFNPDNESKETVQMDMTFTNDRIYIDSDTSMDVMAGLQARGVLVRHDIQDFVVITNQNEGLQVAKSDLESLINLMNRMQGREQNANPEPFPWEEKLVETGSQKDILGYTAHQFILRGDTNSDYVSVWLTDEIVVNWGLLQDAWNAVGSKQFDHEIPIEMVMNNQSFPLLIEAYRNGDVAFKAESISINNDSFDRSKTRLPSDMKLIGLTDLMMNMFRQN